MSKANEAKKSKVGRPRKYEYDGIRKPVSIMLSKEEKIEIKAKFATLQEFIERAKEVLLQE